MSEQTTDGSKKERSFGEFMDAEVARAIEAMPIAVPKAALDRSKSQMRLAFSQHRDKIIGCTPASVTECIILSALTGLFPGGKYPDVWLIPRKQKVKVTDPVTKAVTEKWEMRLNWQASFRGWKRLARRNDWEVDPVLVFGGDAFKLTETHEGTVVEHEPDLAAEKSWKNLRLAYVRVYPSDGTGKTKIAWLNRDEIQKRRDRAQDDSIWVAWPLEQTLKTMASYAGAREMFPCDDQARYALAAEAALHSESPEPVAALVADTGGVIFNATGLHVDRETVPVEARRATKAEKIAAQQVAEALGEEAPGPEPEKGKAPPKAKAKTKAKAKEETAPEEDAEEDVEDHSGPGPGPMDVIHTARNAGIKTAKDLAAAIGEEVNLSDDAGKGWSEMQASLKALGDENPDHLAYLVEFLQEGPK